MPLKEEESLPHEEEVKQAAELREWIEAKISELESEITRYRSMLLLVDSTLRRRSFVSAKELRGTEQIATKPLASKAEPVRVTNEKQSQSLGIETKELRRTPDGEVLANAKVEPERIVITPVASVKLSENIPPFQSFFVNRILKGYQSKDMEASKSGNLPASNVLQYSVKQKEGLITEVTISNYRDKSRLNEILNTVTWAFSRMLEKK